MIEWEEHLLSIVVPLSERAYAKALTEAYQSALEALLKTNGIYTAKRLQDIINSISNELYSINADFKEVFPKDAVPIVSASSKYTEQELALALQHADIAADLYSIPKSMIQEFIELKGINYYRVDKNGTTIKSSTTANSMINSIAKNNVAKVRGIILAEGAIGTSPESIARKIRPYMTTQSKRDVRTVVRSLLGEANSRASDRFYKENEKYIQNYRYDATLDSRTSILCASLSGRLFKRSELGSHNKPKLHPNCRSALIAIPDGYTYGTRPVVDAKGKVHIVRGDMSYNEAQKLGYDLGNKKLINIDVYLKKLGE